ncbi:hypothetical protein NC653_006193 [Populus alba x Populus x berolinensis]|uniref:Uncharacterized protein n=1 Tax=Populus alba x Populus x berolinensis TaxID=444605 RepID=A0AAD6WCS4_9ROSI|nr:hypothetical protein NC653_006193 [Populus alba x Populus x berolinensis]
MTGELSSLLLPPPLPPPLCSARDSGGGSGGGHSRQLYLVPEARHRDHLFPVSLNLSPVSSPGGLCVLHTWLSCNRSSQTVQVWSDWIRDSFHCLPLKFRTLH